MNEKKLAVEQLEWISDEHNVFVRKIRTPKGKIKLHHFCKLSVKKCIKRERINTLISIYYLKKSIKTITNFRFKTKYCNNNDIIISGFYPKKLNILKELLKFNRLGLNYYCYCLPVVRLISFKTYLTQDKSKTLRKSVNMYLHKYILS